MGVQSIVGANGDQKLSYESEGLSAGLAGYDHGAASGALQNLVALKGNRASANVLHPEEIDSFYSELISSHIISYPQIEMETMFELIFLSTASSVRRSAVPLTRQCLPGLKRQRHFGPLLQGWVRSSAKNGDSVIRW